MNVLINDIKPIDSSLQVVFMTITDNAEDFKFISNSPVMTADETQAYFASRLSGIRFRIYKQQYRGADLSETEGDTELEKFTNWIANGCVNPDEAVIEKVAWTGNHKALKDEPLNRGDISQESHDRRGTGSLQERIENLEAIVMGNL